MEVGAEVVLRSELSVTSAPEEDLHEIDGSYRLELEELRNAILKLPAVQAGIEAQARDLSLTLPTSHGTAIDHWLAAEKEALLWIDAALSCSPVVGFAGAAALPPAGGERRNGA